MGQIKAFLKEEDGVGVVEIILILVVLISLVLIFKSQLTSRSSYLLRLGGRSWFLLSGTKRFRSSLLETELAWGDGRI